MPLRALVAGALCAELNVAEVRTNADASGESTSQSEVGLQEQFGNSQNSAPRHGINSMGSTASGGPTPAK